MDRREFLAATAVAAVSPKPKLDKLDTLAQAANRQFIELRRYQLLPGAKQRAFGTYLGEAAIPAMNRAGVGQGRRVHRHLRRECALAAPRPHARVARLRGVAARRMAADAEYNTSRRRDPRRAARRSRPSCASRARCCAPSRRCRHWSRPRSAGTTAPRIYELRTYESHNDKAALNKLKMFNAGEVPIFRKTGLTPVFFGETVLGEKMPSLNYMLTFPDMAARDAAWSAFLKDPDWKTLSGDPQYKENVSAITDLILRPTPFSQI